jgi:hypothetical protein
MVNLRVLLHLLFRKVKRGLIAGLVAVVLILTAAAILLAMAHRGVVHRLPYKWDSYLRPDLHFTMEPMSNVIAAVNSAIRKASGGAVPEAIKLHTTPTRIVNVNSNPSLDPYMNQLITAYREHEKEMNRRGAEGFEGALFTRDLSGRHSLWCELGIMEAGRLHWEAREDGLHASRVPGEMECRPYRVTDELLARMKQQRSEGNYKVDADPVVSALIIEAGIDSSGFMLPQGTNSWTSECHYDKVFRYVPELRTVLALATPEEHAEAKKRVKASGLWVDR